MGKEVKVLIPWYGSEVEFVSNFRKMSVTQLIKYYDKSSSTISAYAKTLELNKFEIINSLTKEEVIYMYESLLNKEVKVFTNGVYNHDKYIVILIKYMVNNILKWSREDICLNYSIKIFKENSLGGLLGIKKFSLYDYLVKSFPEYNIMSWELRSSTVGNGWTEENISKALNWLKNRLLEDKSIDNINLAGTYGFSNLLSNYNLHGLCVVRFGGGYVALFERMYNEKFSKEEMLKDRYTFDINTDHMPTTLENKVYILTDLYNNLDDRGKTLINEVIRFCENNNKFPLEKDLSNNTGYICRTQFYKYFGENTLKQLYNYILPIYDFSKEIDVDKFRNVCDGQNYNVVYVRPIKIKCTKCEEIKEFTEYNFPKSEAQKFGLKYICIECEAGISYEYHLEKFAIRNSISLTNKYDIITWYEAFLNNELKQMPKFCYEENNQIQIIRYVINDKLHLYTKEQICNVNLLGSKQFDIFRIDMSVYKFGGKLKTLQKCFPELNIVSEDVYKELYLDDEMNDIITTWINDNKFTTTDLLSRGITYSFDNKMNAMMSLKFHKAGKSRVDMVIWYCNKNNILHPVYNREIIKWDFEEAPKRFWGNKDNITERIQYYCEYECDENILDSINNNELLKLWIYKYFRQEFIGSMVPYNKSGYSSYEILIETYPQIKENKTLFDWEWHQFNKSDKPTLLRMLRELVKFRLDKYIINPIVDIPIYINMSFIDAVYPKFKKQIFKNRFETFYQWCCEAFPEYAHNWSPEDFGMCVAFDGSRCGSLEEKMVYEYFKKETDLRYIEAIGYKHSGEHVFILPDEHEDNKYCPDFVIEYVDIDNIKTKLTKPMYIEYYGWYTEAYHTNPLVMYREKTWRKNDYFKSLDSITFIDIYPDDLKNNFEGLKVKCNTILDNLTILESIA